MHVAPRSTCIFIVRAKHAFPCLLRSCPRPSRIKERSPSALQALTIAEPALSMQTETATVSKDDPGIDHWIERSSFGIWRNGESSPFQRSSSRMRPMAS